MPQRLPSTKTFQTKKLTHQCALTSHYAVTPSLQAPNHLSQWSRWAIPSWTLNHAVPKNQFTKLSLLQTLPTLQLSIRCFKTQQTRSKLSHQLVWSRASLSLCWPMSSPRSLQDSLILPHRSFSTTAQPTCRLSTCRVAPTPHKLLLVKKSYSSLQSTQEFPNTKSSTSKMNLEFHWSMSGVSQKSTWMKFHSNQSSLSWCQIKFKKFLLRSLLLRKRITRFLHLSLQRIFSISSSTRSAFSTLAPG